MPTIIITIRQKQIQAQTISAHPLILNRRRENASLLSQSKGQGSGVRGQQGSLQSRYVQINT